MKILAIEKLKDVAALTQELESLGISKRRLSESLGASFLPKFGKFEAYGVDGDTGLDAEGKPKIDANGKEMQNTMHIRIGTAKMQDSISLSRLQLDIFSGNPTDKDFRESAKGNFYLPANTVVNPGLKGNQANIIQKLIGKHFAAKKVSGFTTAFNAEGYKSASEVETRPVSNYEIHLFDTADEAKAFSETFENQ